ncbi:MAG: DUF4288 domain-containing protein [Gammaproteobacteria bacterium]
MQYFTARLVILVLADNGKPITECTRDSVIVLIHAPNRDAAFRKALELGKEQETEYENEAGELVRWVFKEVDMIWELGEELTEGEIASVPDKYVPDVPLESTVEFKPEAEEPIYAGSP